MSAFELAIPTVIRHEGEKFTNDPSDPGGATRWGVTLYELKAANLHDPDGSLFADVNHDGRIDIEDIRNLTLATAESYYRIMWWDHYKYDRLAVQDVATKVFDTAVNTGGVPAVKILQRAVNKAWGREILDDDGLLGPHTLDTVNSMLADVILPRYRVLQADYYLALIDKNHKLLKFRGGWLVRAAD